jgi:RNA polymerase sigma-70 factor (ECF subfamily)
MDQDTQRLQTEGEAALADIFSECRDRLLRLIDFRLDKRLQSRVDADDVLQEAYLEVARRLPDFLKTPTVSFYVWVRQLTLQTLIDVQRRHFGQKRSPLNEIHLRYNPAGETSDSIAQIIYSQMSSPSGVAIRAEEAKRLHEALQSMDEIDREVLALRHFEQLGNSEVAEALGLSITAASNRYVRAMTRLGEVMRRIAEST